MHVDVEEMKKRQDKERLKLVLRESQKKYQ
jgi:hypothetical protein